MIEFLKKLYRKNDFFFYILNPIKRCKNYLNYIIYSDKNFIQKAFKKNLGYTLNLDFPQTLNEKIQWLKLNDRRDIHTICADKFLVRNYIKELIGEEYLIPLICVLDNPENINPEHLPNTPFIIKTNHDSGSVTIVRDKTKINWSSVKNKFKSSFKNNFYYVGREWQYKNIKPKIIVEELLLDSNNNIPNDFKLHCFNGKVFCILVEVDRFENHKKNLYSKDWEILQCDWDFQIDCNIKKPNNFEKMIELAELLSKPFDYVRVDFYNIGDKIYFGELTFHPGSGWGFFPPKNFDKSFGNKLNLSNFKKGQI